MTTGSAFTQNYTRSQSEIEEDLHNGAQRINPENRIGSGFRIIPEQYFLGVENINDFLENIYNNLAYYVIPAQIACAYLKGHLKEWTLDWFEVLGYRVIEDKVTDYAHLKKALSEQFPVFRNMSELETRFYSSSQRRDQQPSNFIYELLKIPKVLKLEMSEEKLIDNVVSRLEPQILDYVEVRHPQNTANLLQVVDKYEERFMNRQIRRSNKKIGGKTEIMRDIPIIADHKESLIDSKTKVSQIFGDSRVDAKVDSRISDSAIRAVDKGLFSDQPGLTHVLNDEIDTGDKGPIVSRPYRYDRVKQGIIDYHIDKMLRDGTICPVNSPYASPVVLTRKKNDLPPDSPEGYRFAIDYCKLNGITKYPRYPLPFNLFTDDSGVGIGAVLQQNQKPIAFASRTLNKAERNYTLTERECLAVTWALNKFKTYFGPLPGKVITDHGTMESLGKESFSQCESYCVMFEVFVTNEKISQLLWMQKGRILQRNGGGNV
ncbi:uncharacterized protein TNCV_3265411 [Trichonephila clavipes]|nr:uncharacterized protein TNCV_3265411 [Trichonephila clavipes]